MAYVKISANDCLQWTAFNNQQELRLTGANYDPDENVLILHVAGAGLPDYGEVVVVKTEVPTTFMYPVHKLVSKALAPAE